MSKMNQKHNYRKLRVANTIKLALIKVFQSGKIDPVLFNCKITITKVVPSLGETLYTCYVLPFGEIRISTDEFMRAIHNSLPKIRRMVAQKVNLKYAPELKFVYDHGFDNISEIERILQSLRENKDLDSAH